MPYKQDGQYLRPSDPAYEQVLDSLAMVAQHTPVPLLEALLKWRERYTPSFTFICFYYDYSRYLIRSRVKICLFVLP